MIGLAVEFTSVSVMDAPELDIDVGVIPATDERVHVKTGVGEVLLVIV